VVEDREVDDARVVVLDAEVVERLVDEAELVATWLFEAAAVEVVVDEADVLDERVVDWLEVDES
jgi:hypothetical protein